MEKKELMHLLYNFYCQGCCDGQDGDYVRDDDGDEYYETNRYGSYGCFVECFNDQEIINEKLKNNIYEDGFMDYREIREKMELHREAENLKKLGLEKYLCSKYKKTSGIEKSAYYQLVIGCPNGFTLDEVDKCINRYIASKDRKVSGFGAGEYEMCEVLRKHDTSITEVISSNLKKSNSFEDIKNCVLENCVLFKMQDIFSELRELLIEIGEH